MKKLILPILFASFIVFGFAQKFNGGAMIGLAATQVAGDQLSGFNKAGPIAGFFVNLDVSERSTFQMELYYIQKGSRKNANAVEEDYESYLLRLNYIEMPLLYQFKFGWFAIEAGPAVAFSMGGYEERNGEEIQADDYATATFQIHFGVAFTIAENWKIDIRTNNSLTNLRNETHSYQVRRIFPNNYGQFNDVLQITFAYQFFHFGK